MGNTATRTFLFTDIEGSTRRWETFPVAMGAGLARHDALLRAAIEDHGGSVFKTIGDAFCAAFTDPGSALAAAVAAQRALAAEAWAVEVGALRVRMAVHSGTAEARDGDYFGPTLNRVARLLAAGHGGQVLVSQASEVLVADQLPSGVQLLYLGEYRLKDLARPTRIFQLLAPGLPTGLPPLATLDAHPNNLPAQLDSFIGRTAEIATLGGLLTLPDGPRLVTLTGTGGTGKTRLALQVAAEVVDHFSDGAWLVELAPLSAAAMVPHAVAAALRLPEEPIREPLASLADQLVHRHALLVLDNCEHLIAGAAQVASTLLRACPALRVLATSREPLAIAGEHCLPLEPLGAPSPGESQVEAVAAADAVRLFVDRAVAARPDFAVDRANAAAVAELCRRLDGIPLAIELAAARVRTLSAAQIAARLDDRLRLLTGGARDRLPRQQTLRAAIDWSHDLLPPVEQTVLWRLSVFAGAIPLEAIEAVCAGGDLDPGAILDAVDGLVARSLVVPVEGAEAVGYRLLETIRVYAAEKLAAAGEAEPTRRRHLAWYRGLVEAAGIEVLGPDMDAWVPRLRPLMPDLRALLVLTLASPALATSAMDLMEAGWWIFMTWGGLLYGRQLLDLLLPALGEVDRTGPPGARPTLRWLCGTSLVWTGRPAEARPWFESAAVGFRAAGDLRRESWALQEFGQTAQDLGDLDAAEACFREALRLKRLVGDPTDTCIALLNLGEVLRCRGDLAADLACIDEAVALLGPDERRSRVASYALFNRSMVVWRMGDPGPARAAFADLLALADLLEPHVLTLTLAGVAAFAAVSGASDEAGRLLGVAEAMMDTECQSSGLHVRPVDRAEWQRDVAIVYAQVPATVLAAAVAEGRALGQAEAIELAHDVINHLGNSDLPEAEAGTWPDPDAAPSSGASGG